MNVIRPEPDVVSRSTDPPSQPPVVVRAETGAAQDVELADQRPEDAIEEPGYGHGV